MIELIFKIEEDAFGNVTFGLEEGLNESTDLESDFCNKLLSEVDKWATAIGAKAGGFKVMLMEMPERSRATVPAAKATLQVEFSKVFRRAVREYAKPRRRLIAHTIDSVRNRFGLPHLHSGLGIRRLRRNYFECRAGLEIRLIFRADSGVLTFITAGDHDDVQRFLKNI